MFDKDRCLDDRKRFEIESEENTAFQGDSGYQVSRFPLPVGKDRKGSHDITAREVITRTAKAAEVGRKGKARVHDEGRG